MFVKLENDVIGKRDKYADANLPHIIYIFLRPTLGIAIHTIMYQGKHHSKQVMSAQREAGPRCKGGVNLGPQGVQTNVRFQRDLSENKRVTVDTWNGEVRIDIRNWEANFKFPNKKGLSLTLPRWKTLLSYVDDLTESLNDEQLNHKVQYHLGGGQFATVDPQSFRLDLRQYFVPSESREIHPTRKGIRLSVAEWNNLVSCVAEIRAVIPELESTQMCNEKADHYFHLETLKCRECNPFALLDVPKQY